MNALTEAEGQGHGLRSQMIERYGRQNLAGRGEQAPFLFRQEPVISQSRESGFPTRFQASSFSTRCGLAKEPRYRTNSGEGLCGSSSASWPWFVSR